jgi:hypothetical protein
MNHYDVPGREKQPIEIMRDGMTDDMDLGVGDLTDENLKDVVIGGL